MSDLFRFLPLSNRAGGDETDVSSNWARQTGTVLLQVADLLDGLAPNEWAAPALRAGFTVRTTAGRILWRLTEPKPTRRAEFFRTPKVREQVEAAESARVGEAATSELAERIRVLSADFLEPGTRGSIRDLSVAVTDAFDIAGATGRSLEIDPLASGAVALARSLEGPYDMRAVLGERSLKASDADWKVGFGPELKGTAAAIVLFLWQRHALPDD